jgi:hypothetical protein
MQQRYKIETAIIRPVIFRFTFVNMNITLRILILFGWLFVFPYASLHAQKHESDKYGFGVKIGNDTIIHRDIEEVSVYPRNSKISHFTRYYSRLALRVKKVYPYAQKANELLKKYEPQYYTLKTDKERRKLMKDIEDQLLSEYKDDLKRMTISDGRVLIKLIDRETGKTSFTLIKEFRGGFSAAFWQGIARIFKNNLKEEYDPYGEDRLIEDIVILIEFGYL